MFCFEKKNLLLSPEPGSPNGGTSLDQDPQPEAFNTRDAVENAEDENMIIGDQDETDLEMAADEDENMGTNRKVAQSLEDEPKVFVRGEIDVKTQIDRANRRMDDAAHGTRNWEEGPDASDVNLELADKNSHSPRGNSEEKNRSARCRRSTRGTDALARRPSRIVASSALVSEAARSPSRDCGCR